MYFLHPLTEAKNTLVSQFLQLHEAKFYHIYLFE